MTDEAWLWRNPKALASVLRGLAQAARGEFAEPPNEKGEQMAAIDDATAKRIAEHLRASGMALDVRVMGGRDQLAATIQEAAEPPPIVGNATGHYFVQHTGGVHMEVLGIDASGAGWRVWEGAAKQPEPHGKLISGPHTCEELLEAVRRPAEAPLALG